MYRDEFRECYKELGPIMDLLIGNVIVGTMDWRGAMVIADALMKRWVLGSYAQSEGQRKWP